MPPIRFLLNERSVETALPPTMPLVDYLRYEAGLTGVKVGCREGDCGACTVLLGVGRDGGVAYAPVVSCLQTIGHVAGGHVVTIEGLRGAEAGPVARALAESGAVQCGFCTPGLVTAMTGFLLSAPCITESAMLEAAAGNICRCTGYQAIRRAVRVVVDACGAVPEGGRLSWLIAAGIVPAYFADTAARLARLDVPAVDSTAPLVMGGGTDLLVRGPLPAERVRCLLHEENLRGIREGDAGIEIGAAVTTRELAQSPLLQRLLPGLCAAVPRIASPAVREVATIAGNFVNASPAGDLVVMFLALAAELHTSAGRVIPLRRFFRGYKQVDLAAGEIIERVVVPRPVGVFRFEKVARRAYLDIAAVNSAACIQAADGVIGAADLAVGGVAPIPLWLPLTGAYLNGRPLNAATVRAAADVADGEIHPISDVRGSAAYKRLLVRHLIYAHFIELFPSSRLGEVLP